MSKEVTTISTEGFSATSEIGDYELTIDAGGEETQDTLDTLLATYATCYVPALRVGGKQRDVDDLGRIEIDVVGELNDDDKLSAISFDVRVEADISDDKGDAILERAFELCKVHDALKSELHADSTISGGAT